jgi:hypothetical protein
MDIPREKADFEFLNLLGEQVKHRRISAFHRSKNPPEKLRARQEVKCLKYLDGEYILEAPPTVTVFYGVALPGEFMQESTEAIRSLFHPRSLS